MHKIYSLNNGITVVSYPMKEMMSVSIGFWIKVGSSIETEFNQGVAHFIEHMLFRGTKNRTSKQISAEIGKLGGYLNAFTSREYTCYFARVPENGLSKAIELLSDMLINSSFKPEHIDKERNVILDELISCEDDPEELAYDNLMHIAFGGNSFGEPIVGNRDFIKNANRNDLLSFKNKYYTADNIIISISGRYDEDKAVYELNKWFDISQNNANKADFLSANDGSLVFNSGYILEKQDREQLYITMGYKAPSLLDDRRYAFMIFNSIVGSGSTSRLFEHIRENEGLTYAIDSNANGFEKIGIFGIDTSLNVEVFSKFVKKFIPIIKSLSRGEISDKEIEHTKLELMGSLIINREGTEQIMMDNGEQYLFFDRIYSMENTLSSIKNVNPDDVRQLAVEILNSKPVVSVVGNIDEDKVRNFYLRLL